MDANISMCNTLLFWCMKRHLANIKAKKASSHGKPDGGISSAAARPEPSVQQGQMGYWAGATPPPCLWLAASCEWSQFVFTFFGHRNFHKFSSVCPWNISSLPFRSWEIVTAWRPFAGSSIPNPWWQWGTSTTSWCWRMGSWAGCNIKGMNRNVYAWHMTSYQSHRFVKASLYLYLWSIQDFLNSYFTKNIDSIRKTKYVLPLGNDVSPDSSAAVPLVWNCLVWWCSRLSTLDLNLATIWKILQQIDSHKKTTLGLIIALWWSNIYCAW